MKSILPTLFVLPLFAVVCFSQEPSPTPAPTPIPQSVLIEEQKKLYELQTQLLKAQTEYLKAYADAAGNSSISRDTAGGKITYKYEDKPIFEVIDLSYDALDEIAGKAGDRIRPFSAGYERIVIFDDRDFAALSRYRMYREEARLALANYEKLMKDIEAFAESDQKRNPINLESTDQVRQNPLITALGSISIAESALKSAAQLISLFRTETEITQSKVEIDQRTVNTVMAGVLLKDGRLKVYNSSQFVPEYDLAFNDPQSFYRILSELRAAAAVIFYLEEAAKTGTPREKNDPDAARLIARIRMMKSQLNLLSFSIEPDPIPEKDDEKKAFTEFRSMVRAEKLDKFIKGGGNVGILKLNVLSSGGSHRERKNILLGTRNDYSGSTVIELALYDLDGTMRVSEVMKHHTGFRKYKVQKLKQIP
ncbi:MAG TPA: hypothetical protein PKA82_08035 [Pyrinomonadaceae bacterium]|nr:hypothetical protein [Pyrinomonadaceae bacterium]